MARTEIIGVAFLYKPPKIDKSVPDYPPIIVCLPRPFRHHHIGMALSQMHETAALEAVQGFIADDGSFLTREEAKDFVECMNIPTIGNHSDTQLFSEDLW